MKRIILIFSILMFSLTAKSAFCADDDFAKTPLGKELVNIGLKFLDNPGDFFFNLHASNEDFSPVPTDKRVSLRTNFFPTTLPLTWMNLNVKVKVLDDAGYVPQVDLVGMYGDLIALRAASSSMEDVKPIFNDYSIGAVLSKKADEKTRLFAGAKFSTVQLSVKLSSSSAVTFGDFTLDSIDFKVSDTFFFSGIAHQSGPNRYVVAQAGYGMESRKIVARVMVSKKHFQYGLDVFPEGLFVIHPFMSWHWDF